MAKKKATVEAKQRKGARPKAALYATLRVDIRNGIALIALARPEVHNAFDATMVAELTSALQAAAGDDGVRAVVLLADGANFCAGADLRSMRRMAKASAAANLADAMAMATLLKTLDRLAKPTIARVHGAAFGSGVGLVACCDIAIGAQDAIFSLSETKLGLIPALVSPYVIEAIGVRNARRYFLSAERFTAAEAYRIGLLHDLAPADELDARVNEILGALLVAGPQAQAAAKSLVRDIAARPIGDALIADTAQRIASTRASVEGKEGIAAFLDRRAPAWVPDALKLP